MKGKISVNTKKAYRGRRSPAPLILKLGARSRSMVGIMPHPLYPWKRKSLPNE
jgi:hypothetical protein